FNDVSNDIACDGFNTSIERQCVRYSAPDLIPVKAESLKDTLNSSLAVGAYFAKKEKSNINKKSSKRKKRK
ncbi:hypothetical protein, partial [Photobacterium iliopiscarium]|uniref:hypothetical protein n=2 Tax=Vibrionaceae TaxID=641 RepID=UPI001E32A3D9